MFRNHALVVGPIDVGLMLQTFDLDCRPRRLDWQNHDSFAEGRKNEAVPLIESNSVVINGVGDNRSYPGDLGHLETSPHAVVQQVRPQPLALILSIDSQPTDE